VKPFSVHVYVEGGGPARGGDLADECRKGFSTLFEKATGRRIGILARVDPRKLDACPHAKALFENLMGIPTA